jgi:hypothetical protein
METCHVSGLAILAFVALPAFDSAHAGSKNFFVYFTGVVNMSLLYFIMKQSLLLKTGSPKINFLFILRLLRTERTELGEHGYTQVPKRLDNFSLLFDN